MAFSTQRPLSADEKFEKLVALKKSRSNSIKAIKESYVPYDDFSENIMSAMECIDAESDAEFDRMVNIDKMRTKQCCKSKGQLKMSLYNKLYDEGMKKLTNDTLYKLVYNSLWIDDTVKSSMCNELKNSFCTIMNSIENNFASSKCSDDTVYVQNVKCAIRETVEKAATRLTKDAEANDEYDDVEFDISEDEEDELDNKLSNLGTDQIVQLVKDKVLTVVQDEQKAGIAKKELIKQIQDTKNNASDIDDMGMDDMRKNSKPTEESWRYTMMTEAIDFEQDRDKFEVIFRRGCEAVSTKHYDDAIPDLKRSLVLIDRIEKSIYAKDISDMNQANRCMQLYNSVQSTAPSNFRRNMPSYTTSDFLRRENSVYEDVIKSSKSLVSELIKFCDNGGEYSEKEKDRRGIDDSNTGKTEELSEGFSNIVNAVKTHNEQRSLKQFKSASTSLITTYEHICDNGSLKQTKKACDAIEIYISNYKTGLNNTKKDRDKLSYYVDWVSVYEDTLSELKRLRPLLNKRLKSLESESVSEGFADVKVAAGNGIATIKRKLKACGDAMRDRRNLNTIKITRSSLIDDINEATYGELAAIKGEVEDDISFFEFAIKDKTHIHKNELVVENYKNHVKWLKNTVIPKIDSRMKNLEKYNGVKSLKQHRSSVGYEYGFDSNGTSSFKVKTESMSYGDMVAQSKIRRLNQSTGTSLFEAIMIHSLKSLTESDDLLDDKLVKEAIDDDNDSSDDDKSILDIEEAFGIGKHREPSELKVRHTEYGDMTGFDYMIASIDESISNINTKFGTSKKAIKKYYTLYNMVCSEISIYKKGLVNPKKQAINTAEYRKAVNKYIADLNNRERKINKAIDKCQTAMKTSVKESAFANLSIESKNTAALYEAIFMYTVMETLSTIKLYDFKPQEMRNYSRKLTFSK